MGSSMSLAGARAAGREIRVRAALVERHLLCQRAENYYKSP